MNRTIIINGMSSNRLWQTFLPKDFHPMVFQRWTRSSIEHRSLRINVISVSANRVFFHNRISSSDKLRNCPYTFLHWERETSHQWGDSHVLSVNAPWKILSESTHSTDRDHRWFVGATHSSSVVQHHVHSFLLAILLFHYECVEQSSDERELIHSLQSFWRH